MRSRGLLRGTLGRRGRVSTKLLRSSARVELDSDRRASYVQDIVCGVGLPLSSTASEHGRLLAAVGPGQSLAAPANQDDALGVPEYRGAATRNGLRSLRATDRHRGPIRP